MSPPLVVNEQDAPNTAVDLTAYRGIREIAREVGVKPATVRRAVTSGDLPAMRWQGYRLLILPSDAQAWLARNLQPVIPQEGGTP